MSATRTPGRPEVPGSDAAVLAPPALDWLRTRADDGLVALDARGLAAELHVRTVAVPGIVGELVGAGLLRALGAGLYALPGSPAETYVTERGPLGPRSEPHRPLHDGEGGLRLW
jgi:hypothetical protein